MLARSELESDLTFHQSSTSSFCEEFASKATVIQEFDKLEGDEEEEEEDDFTFCAVGDETFSSSTAEDMFQDGKIRPVFPLFDQSLVELPHLPPVRKVFVEAGASPPYPGTAAAAEGEAVGPYCAWSVEAAAASLEGCKKSNSTGFSKMWRFKEMSSRSNSDGRDAFVFLHKPAAEKKGKNSAAAVMVANKKKGGKEKATASSSTASAHEVYVKSRAAATREEDRRRSYLPYKPELVGFFTNVHGGMSKNVHPF